MILNWRKLENGGGRLIALLGNMKQTEATREALRKLRSWQQTGQLQEERFKRLQTVLENRIARCYAKSA